MSRPTSFENENEKDLQKISHVENGVTEDLTDIDRGFSPELVKRTVRKIDWRLIPILSAVYTISLIDRTNLSTARAANAKQMDHDIGTNIGQRYSIITVMFFVPYIILELPVSYGEVSALISSLNLVFASLVPRSGLEQLLFFGVSS